MKTIDVAELVDGRPLGGMQVLVLLLAGITVLLDGLDIQAVAFAAPKIAADLGLERSALGPVFSAGLLGMASGSLLMGPVADRFGRRRAVLLSVAAFGSFTLMTAFADSFYELMLFRFLTGLGLGGALPSLVVLVGEYSPRRIRAIATGLVLAGVPGGGLLGGLLANWAIPLYGWPSIFLIGGGLPLLLLPLLAWQLPESLHFLATRAQPDPAGIRKLLLRLGVGGDDGTEIRLATPRAPAAVSQGVPMARLFAGSMARKTLLLWCAFFTNLMGIYFLMSWIPTLLVDAGYPLSKATTTAVVFNLGGLVGLLGLGWLVSRFGLQIRHVIAFALLFGSIHVALVGVLAAQLSLLLAAIFVAGAFVMGTQGQLFNLGTTLYPIELRATGLGTAVGVGRIGSVLGPLVGSALVLTTLGLSTYFALFGALLFLGAIAVMGVGRESLD